MKTLSILLMLSVSALCFWGCISPRYKDNLLQRIGMSVLGVAFAARAASVYDQGPELTPALVSIAVGILCFGAGVVVKVRKYSRRSLHGGPVTVQVAPGGRR